MRWREIIAEAAKDEFETLEDIQGWARTIGVKLEVTEYVNQPGQRYAGSIDLVWIARSKKTKPGAGRRVMEALCLYADSTHSEIHLQADDEVGLPAYYAQFGFKIVKSDSGDDVTPTGPDMLRRPRTKKARRLLGSARPFNGDHSIPVGVALMFNYGSDKPSYFMMFPPGKVAQAKEDVSNRIYDSEDVWIGYIIDTPEWTELAAKMASREPQYVPSIIPDASEPKVIRSNKRWNDINKLGKMVFKVTN